jgi:hypothetical protein
VTDSSELLERLRALAEVLPRLESPGAEAAFGVWEPMREARPGVSTMPYVRYGELRDAFGRAAAGWVRPDIDWMTWAATGEGQALGRNPELVGSAGPEDLARLLTTVIRGDRFNEGMLLDAFTSGLLAAISRRAAVLADELGRASGG